ncbi:hypothetical protein [Streptomyces sp. NPDC053720]
MSPSRDFWTDGPNVSSTMTSPSTGSVITWATNRAYQVGEFSSAR